MRKKVALLQLGVTENNLEWIIWRNLHLNV